VDLIQIAEENITRLESELRLAKLQRVKLREAVREAELALIVENQPHITKREKASAVKAIAPAMPRAETPAEHEAKPSVKPLRKAGAPRGPRGSRQSIGARILALMDAQQGMRVGEIAEAINAEKRSVSYTLQNLKKAGKVRGDREYWWLVQTDVAQDEPLAEFGDDGAFDEALNLTRESVAEAAGAAPIADPPYWPGQAV